MGPTPLPNFDHPPLMGEHPPERDSPSSLRESVRLLLRRPGRVSSAPAASAGDSAFERAAALPSPSASPERTSRHSPHISPHIPRIFPHRASASPPAPLLSIVASGVSLLVARRSHRSSARASRGRLSRRAIARLLVRPRRARHADRARLRPLREGVPRRGALARVEDRVPPRRRHQDPPEGRRPTKTTCASRWRRSSSSASRGTRTSSSCSPRARARTRSSSRRRSATRSRTSS